MFASHRLLLLITTLLLMLPAASAQTPGSTFPATAETSDQKTGSVLFFNIYTSKAATPEAENTSLSFTNTHDTRPVTLLLLFVDGSNGSVTDTSLQLPPKGTMAILASDYDPDSTGFLIAVAVDPTTHYPISFNYLTGSEYVKFASGHFGSLGAQAFAALFQGTMGGWTPNQTAATLVFDGNQFSGFSYNRAPRTLSLTSIPSRPEGNNTKLILNRFGGNLVSGATPPVGAVAGVMFDQLENGYGFNLQSGPQFNASLSSSTLRTTPRFEQIVSFGSSGWLRLWPVNEMGILGAALNYNPNASGYSTATNLHALSLAPSVTLTIPVIAGGTNLTSTTIASPLNPATSGDSVTFTATVTALSSPTGSVQFYDGSSLLGTVTLSGSTATLTTSTLTPGDHLISAVYLGNGTLLPSASGSLTQTINRSVKAATTTALATSINPSVQGQAITLTAAVTGSGATPGGTVQFLDGASLAGAATLSNGAATLTLANLSTGTHSMTAVYGGDANFLGSASSAVSQVVQPLMADESQLSDNQAGSVLFYNLYSSGANPNTENTDLSLTNTDSTNSVAAHLFFVRGNDGSVKDQFVTLAPGQTKSLLASITDPGKTGHVIAVAIDEATGLPVSFNHLTGDAYIKLASGHRAHLPAVAFAALYAGTLPGLTAGASAATLNFDGAVYNKGARVLAVDNLPSSQDGNSSQLILNRFGGNLVPGAVSTTLAGFSGLVYDQLTSSYPFSFTASATAKAQFRQTLNSSFPNTSPALNFIIPAGTSGWLRVQADSGSLATLGAMLNAGSGFNVFTGGHNLRVESLQNAALTIPVYAPSALADLSITKTHSGVFKTGSTGSYIITVSNAAAARPVSGTITISDNLPGNLTLASFSGTGWNCIGTGTANVNCTCSSGVAGGTSLPPLTLTVNVGSGTAGSVTNTATVTATDAESATANNTASDVTTINLPPTFTSPPTLTVQQGNQASIFTIATVSDDLTAAASLTVTTTAVPDGLAISDLTNNDGTITAIITTDCAITVGNKQLGLKVRDSDGLETTASVNVNVTANTPPAFGAYQAATVGTGGTVTITPGSAPSDNGLISTVTASADNGFTGSLSVNPATGAVTVLNAGPSGSFIITVTAADNCNSSSSVTIPLTVSPLTATTMTLTASTNPSIAGQAVTFTATLTPATATGSVNFSSGNTLLGTATIVNGTAVFTTSALSPGSYTINATYSGDALHAGSQSPGLAHTVVNTGTGSNVTVSIDSNTTVSFASVSQPGSTTLTTIDPATAGPLPAGYTLAGTELAFDLSTTAVFTGPVVVTFKVASLTDQDQFLRLRVLHRENGVLIDRTILSPDSPAPSFGTKTVSARVTSLSPFVLALADTAIGPGALPAPSSPASDDKAGSVLVYNLYSSSITRPGAENTRIIITNADETRSAWVHFFLIDGSSCNAANFFICLTQKQTLSFLASDIDPGIRGYIIAVAVDQFTGCPVSLNSLTGSAWIKLQSGHTASLPAEAFAALTDTPVNCSPTATTATLNFDNVSYNAAARVLAVSSFPSPSDGNSTLLVVNRLGGTLTSGTQAIGPVHGLVFDDIEASYSFDLTAGCQLSQILSKDFPRTTPRLNRIVPNEHTGWMKLWATNDAGLTGALINLNPLFRNNLHAYEQGHNLHHLTLTTSAQLTIPVTPPMCN